jgi:hypothetical protein
MFSNKLPVDLCILFLSRRSVEQTPIFGPIYRKTRTISCLTYRDIISDFFMCGSPIGLLLAYRQGDSTVHTAHSCVHLALSAQATPPPSQVFYSDVTQISKGIIDYLEGILTISLCLNACAATLLGTQ